MHHTTFPLGFFIVSNDGFARISFHFDFVKLSSVQLRGTDDISQIDALMLLQMTASQKSHFIDFEGGVTGCEYVRYRNLSWVPETAT